MTTWNKPISWSKFKLAIDCPKQLKYTIDREPVAETRQNYYMELGTITQFVFEQIFNQGINQKPGGDKLSTYQKCTEIVFKSKWYAARQITYPLGKSEDTLKEDVRAAVVRGWEIFTKLKLVNKPIRSEVKWTSTFRNMRLFALIDFVYEGSNSIYLFDGKGHAEKNADPRQLFFYALAVQSSNKTVGGGGFIYWKHDYEKLDLSPASIKEFVDGEFVEGRKVMEQLVRGVESLPAKPGKACKFCNWKFVCPDSTELKPPADHTLPDQVGFKSD